MTGHDREYPNGDVPAEGSGAAGGAPLLRTTEGRTPKGRLPKAGDRETEEFLFQPGLPAEASAQAGGWPEFQNVW